MSSCTYKFKNASGEEVTITGQAEMKAFLANGGLEQLLPGKVLPWQKPDELERKVSEYDSQKGRSVLDGTASQLHKRLASLVQKRDQANEKHMQRYREGSATRAKTTTHNARISDLNEQIQELRDAIKAADNPAKLQSDIEVSDKPFALSDLDALQSSLQDGSATVDQYQSAWASFKQGQDAFMAELTKKTKPQLLDMVGGYMAYRLKSENKPEIIKAVFEAARNVFGLGRDYGPQSFYMGEYKKYQEAKDKAFAEMVEATTAEDLRKYADEVSAADAERQAKREEVMQAIKDPQTLEDFRTYMRAAVSDGKTEAEARLALTPEQRARMDDLYAEESRKGRTSRSEPAVSAASVTTGGDVVATKHTQTGEDLYVVRPAERVERDQYNIWNATAKRLGGWYSKYRGNGAVPGFQFKTRESAEAFLAYLGGDTEGAKQVAEDRRDAFTDDRSQTAVERLTEMADRLEERADESLSRDRKANTDRRARMAASAEASANADKAMARTMRNIANAIKDGKAKFLDKVRQKVQAELLASFVRDAKHAELTERYPSYADFERNRYEKPTAETADYAVFPKYTANRSDLARMGREMEVIDGAKQMGQRILKAADDATDEYLKFVKGNLGKVSTFRMKDGSPAIYSSRDDAERAIARSGYRGKAMVFSVKRGQNLVVMGPAMAQEHGLWQADSDKRITLTDESGEELTAKAEALNKGREKVHLPYQFSTTRERRAKLKAMGIETPAEFRAALREFIALSEAPEQPNRVKELERSMVGRRNDGLDFFPTPAGIAQQMIEAADLKEGMSVLEPSAGMGHIAEQIREAGVDPDVVEFSGDRRELLEAKGFNVVANDFMEASGEYDRIIMNPPFSDRRDAQHVRHAYNLLKPGGRLVAIMGEGVFFGQDKRAAEFREWLESVGGTSEKLPDGSFLDPSLPVNTGVNARMVVIEKAADAQPATDSPDHEQGIALYEIDENGDPSPKEAEAVQRGLEGKNPIEAAAWLAENAPPQYATIAAKVHDKLQDLSSNFGVNFGLSIVYPGAMAESELSVARGATIPVQQDGGVALRIVLNGAGMKGRVGTSYRTALHELAHAATMQSVQLGHKGFPQYAQSVRDLVDVANAINRHMGMRAKTKPAELTDFERSVLSGRSNLFESIDEVLVWGMTSPDAQAYLESIPYNSKSLWTAFVAAVRKVLGLSESNDTALSEILRISEVLMKPLDVDGSAGFARLNSRYEIQQPHGGRAFRNPGGVDDATWTGEAVDEGAARSSALVASIRAKSESPAVLRTDVLPDTITIDGVDRPTKNSKGQPIHPTEEGLRNFWRWFGDSKVVDDQGRPLVVYHGTAEDGIDVPRTPYGGMYFAFDPAASEAYADLRGRSSGKVEAVFVSAKNVFDAKSKDAAKVLDAIEQDYDNGTDYTDPDDGEYMPLREWVKSGYLFRLGRDVQNEVMESIRAEGYDAVRYVDASPMTGDSESLVVFSPNHIKSATGNAGTFDPSSPDIRFRTDFDERPARAGWTESRIDRLIGEFAYDFDGTRTKAYAAFVNPDDFLSATTPKSERDKLEAEAKPLDREGLAGETQPIYLQVRETDEDGVFKIIGHEGRHRMMALRDAGYSRVPVVLIFPGAVYDAAEIEEPYFIAQKFGDGTKAAKGFSARSATPITSGNRADLVEEFSSNASGNNDIRFRNDYPDTQAFREWFGNSKMTNKAGEPLLFMHGSPASFEAFDSSKLGTSSSHTSSGLGHFFTRDRSTAEKYADGGNIYTGWLRIEKPYVMMLEEAQAFDDAADSANRRAELQKQGYDGVVILDDEGKPWATVAFEPWQFKSTDNNGSFDEFDDRMRFRDDPSSMRDAPAVPRDQAEEFIRKFVAEYPGAPQIMLADSFYQLPEDIQSDALEQGSGPTRAKGALKNGKAYVVLNTHTSMADLEASVFHEVLGHAGIRKLLGPAFAQELNKMFIGLGGYSKLYQIMSRRGMGRQFEGYYDAVQRAREKNPEVWTEFLASSILTEEVFAHIAEQKNAKALRDRFMALVGMVRDWLRRNGFARLASMGESDIVFLLQRARAGLKNGSGVIRDGVTIGETVIVDAEGRPVAKKGSPDYEMLKAVSERMGLRETNGPTVFSNSLPEEGDVLDGAPASASSDDIPVFRTVTPEPVRTRLADLMDSFKGDSAKTFNWWQRTIGSQYGKAKSDRDFGRVYDAAHAFLDGVADFAKTASTLAPNILPHLDTLKDVANGLDIKKQWSDSKDYQAVSSAIFEGTLANGTTGKVWSDAELQDRFNLNQQQIDLYREFRKSVDFSLDTLAASELARLARASQMDVADRDASLDDALSFYLKQLNPRIKAARAAVEGRGGEIVARHIEERAMLEEAAAYITEKQADLLRKEMQSRHDKEIAEVMGAERKLEELRASFTEKVDQIRKLQSEGYAPLMRFGQYTVDVVKLDANGKPELGENGEPDRPFFGMFETESEARRAAKALSEDYPDHVVTQGVLSVDASQLYKGVTPETAEMFARMLGTDKDDAFQTYLKQAVANRSAMKRLINRMGIDGFSNDVPRVLASFITSNARLASGNWHFGEMAKAVEAIPKQKGDVKDEAIRLMQYVQNPQEEAAGLRGFLFFSFLGGSIASAMVNLTQTFSTTLPYLHQFGGAAVAKALPKAMALSGKMMTKGLAAVPDGELKDALKKASDEGVVDPQEIHLLMAESGGNGSSVGVSSFAGAINKQWATPAARVTRSLTQAWGMFFGAAEKYNRHVAFIAAWEVAPNGVDRYEFAKNAVTETQFDYTKASRPNWARGAVGATLFTFKTFMVNYIEFMSRLPPRERALALAVLFLMAGMSGIPGADDLDDVVDTVAQKMGYNWNNSAARHAWLAKTLTVGGADFVERGLSSLLPLDVSARLGMGNIVPGTGILMKSNDKPARDIQEFFGPIASVFAGGKEVFDDIGSGKGVLEMVRPIAPKAYGDLYQAVDMIQTGQYRDRAGRKVVDVSALDATLKAVGFQPNAVAGPRRIERMLAQSAAMHRAVRQDIHELMARGRYENDADKVAAARGMMKAWNVKNPETPIRLNPTGVATRVRAMRQSSADRLVKATPKDMRGALSAELAVTP